MKSHTHTQPVVNHKSILTLLMLVAFTCIASLQAKSQTSLYLSNKSNCPFDVVIYYCSGSSANTGCGVSAANNFPLTDNIEYFKVFFSGNTSADIIIFPGFCSLPSQSGMNPCGGYYAGSGPPQQYNFSAY